LIYDHLLTRIYE